MRKAGVAKEHVLVCSAQTGHPVPRNMRWLGGALGKVAFGTAQKLFQPMLANLISCLQSWQECGGFALSVRCLLDKAMPAELAVSS